MSVPGYIKEIQDKRYGIMREGGNFTYYTTYGHIADLVSADNDEILWSAKSDKTALATVDTIDFVSSATQDAFPSGDGARLLRVIGLDSNYDQQFEIIEMDGQTPVTSALSYLRVNEVLVLNAGTSRTNVGTITGDYTSVPVTQVHIEPSESLAKTSFFTVPRDRLGYIGSFSLFASNLGGNTPIITFTLCINGDFTPPGLDTFNTIVRQFTIELDTSVTDTITIEDSLFQIVPPMSDIYFIVSSSSNNATRVSARMNLVFEKGGNAVRPFV